MLNAARFCLFLCLGTLKHCWRSTFAKNGYSSVCGCFRYFQMILNKCPRAALSRSTLFFILLDFLFRSVLWFVFFFSSVVWSPSFCTSFIRHLLLVIRVVCRWNCVSDTDMAVKYVNLCVRYRGSPTPFDRKVNLLIAADTETILQSKPQLAITKASTLVRCLPNTKLRWSYIFCVRCIFTVSRFSHWLSHTCTSYRPKAHGRRRQQHSRHSFTHFIYTVCRHTIKIGLLAGWWARECVCACYVHSAHVVERRLLCYVLLGSSPYMHSIVRRTCYILSFFHSFIVVSTRRHPNRNQNENQLSNAMQSKAFTLFLCFLFVVRYVAFCSLFSPCLAFWLMNATSSLIRSNNNDTKINWQMYFKRCTWMFNQFYGFRWVHSISAYLIRESLWNSSSNFDSSWFIGWFLFFFSSSFTYGFFCSHTYIIRHFFVFVSFLFSYIFIFLFSYLFLMFCFQRNKMRQTMIQIYFCHRYKLNHNLKWKHRTQNNTKCHYTNLL